MTERTRILIAQKRFKEAGNMLQDMIAEDPDDHHSLALYSEVCLELKELDKAMALIEQAIGLAPYHDTYFNTRSRIQLQRNDHDGAESSIAEACRLDPSDPHNFALWAHIRLLRKKYDQALELANKALELDPENVHGLNVRSSALLKLNRKEEAFNTIEGALAEDPHDAFTHANYGWGLLEKGDKNKAQEHFREALMIDPDSASARAGLAETMKARSPFYRAFLAYSFWMSKMTAKYQWGVIIGFYLAFRFIRTVAEKNEGLQPFLYPLLVVLALIAISTWVARPLNDLWLRLDKFGKHLLDDHEIKGANAVGICLLICLVGVAGYFLLDQPFWLALSAFGFAMMLPMAQFFTPSANRTKLMVYSAVMAVLGVLAITVAAGTGNLFNPFAILFLLSFFAFQWLANYFSIREDNV